MIPASVLMAVRVYDRASDAMCPRFFGIFRSSCLSAHQLVFSLALKAGCGFVAPLLNHSTRVRPRRNGWRSAICATRSKAPGPAVGYGPHRTIYLTGIECQWQGREGFRAQELTSD